MDRANGLLAASPFHDAALARTLHGNARAMTRSPPPAPAHQRQSPLPALDAVAAASATSSEGDALSDAAAAATLFLARAFRAGVPLRPALDATAARHGHLAWDSPSAQERVLRHTLALEPLLRRPPYNIADFSFGTLRNARFTRLLLAEVESARAPLSETLALAAAEACAAVSAAEQADEPADDVAVAAAAAAAAAVENMCHVTFATPPPPPLPGLCESASPAPDIVVRVAQHFSCLGRRVWTAGLVLHTMVRDPASRVGRAVRGLQLRGVGESERRGVLELGAGTGVCAGALAAAIGNGSVVLADLPDVVWNLQYNARLNTATERRTDADADTDTDTGADVRVETLDLMNSEEVVEKARTWKIGVCVAADVTYDEVLIDGVVRTMAALAKRAGVVSFLLATSRSVDTDVHLAERLEGCGARVEPIKVDVLRGAFDYVVDADIDAVRAFEIR